MALSTIVVNNIIRDKEIIRARINVRVIFRNEEMADKLTRLVNTFRGVIHASSNPLTSNMLIIFNSNWTSVGEIQRGILKHLFSTNLRKETYDFEASAELAIKTYSEKPPQNWDYGLMEIAEIVDSLDTNLSYGLRRSQYVERFKNFGPNTIVEKKRTSLISYILDGLRVYTTKLLLGVSIISLVMGHIPDGLAILVIVAIQTALGAYQQSKAEESMFSIKGMITSKARVIRDGKAKEIEGRYLVPGDIILIEGGDKIPADGRIVESHSLITVESSLTGESYGVVKSNKSIGSFDTSKSLLKENMVYMGTMVASGRGKAVITATGNDTEIGKVAYVIQDIHSDTTPLQREINRFTKGLTLICLGGMVILGGIALSFGADIGQILTLGISISLGALPESLPIVFTISMASGVRRLSQKNAIVRSLSSLEALGAAEVLCCDKTGTLTMNEMTVRKIFANNTFYNITGEGYNPLGQITMENGEGIKDSLEKLLTAGVLCNNAELRKKSDGHWQLIGDPTEGALLSLAFKGNLEVEHVRNKYKCLKEIPFDSDKSYMGVIVKDKGDKRTAFIKGALESIINKCTTVEKNGNVQLFTSSEKEEIEKVNGEFAKEGLRVLALAQKSKLNKSLDIESNLTFLGLIAMEDPPKPGIQDVIKRFNKLGVRVVILTGDHKGTAQAIAKKIGITNFNNIINGHELDLLSDEELKEKIIDTGIFSRTSPTQKYRIVKAFKETGRVVAMAGDGINDAPALKCANASIAMGFRGSDVAKDTASITLVDDNLETIIYGIEEGRSIIQNIRNSTKYLMSGSIGEIASIALCGLFFKVLPLTSIQILWINMVSETIMGSSLAVEGQQNDMKYNRDNVKGIFKGDVKEHIIKSGAAIGFSSFAVFAISKAMGLSLSKSRTLVFGNLILSQMVNLKSCSKNQGIINPLSGLAMAALFGMVYSPLMNNVFGLTPLNAKELALIGSSAFIGTIIK